MCGIVGYAGIGNAAGFLLDGLESLEYRGYDSSGIAVLDGEELMLEKRNGRLSNLKAAVSGMVNGNTGIGHTRWATHGVPAEKNAHPHVSGDIAVVHNGIIENHEKLRSFLIEKGYRFLSETDTETIPHLINYFYKGDLLSAVRDAVKMLEGSYAVCVISSKEKGKIIATRKDSPLICGRGDSESFIASDIPAILPKTNKIYLLEDGEFAVVTKEGIEFSDLTGNIVGKEVYQVTFTAEAAEKCGYEHYMLKEIHEQPMAVKNTLSGRLHADGKLELSCIDKEFFQKAERIYIIGCGTAYHAGLAGKRAIEELAGIPVETDLASEFRYRNPILSENTPLIVISQSGETADTLAVLRMAKEKGSKVLAVTNVQGSSAAREADYVLYTFAGPEIAVASTKAYTTQLVVLFMLACFAAECVGRDVSEIKKEIMTIPEKISESLLLEKSVREIAGAICFERDIYYMGRGSDYAVSMEASLKLKEISYIHCDAYAGGELKHGPIALIENDTVVITVSTNPAISQKTDSNMKEVIARGAFTVGFTAPGCSNSDYKANITLPEINPLLAPAVAIAPLQLLAYYVAVDKGCDVDKPRNLAKSVTVE